MTDTREKRYTATGGPRSDGSFTWAEIMRAAEEYDDARADASRAGVIVWCAVGWLVFAAGVAGLCYWIGTKV